MAKKVNPEDLEKLTKHLQCLCQLVKSNPTGVDKGEWLLPLIEKMSALPNDSIIVDFCQTSPSNYTFTGAMYIDKAIETLFQWVELRRLRLTDMLVNFHSNPCFIHFFFKEVAI